MWFLQKRALDRPISGPILQEKALAFSPKLASPGWLRNLTRLAKSWHGIHELKIHSEKLSADRESAAKFTRQIGQITSHNKRNIYYSASN
ncbi:Jerky protein [Trichinella patagoniensis]|uniref:Jerky protein n=1 Tax=Trichinella patagoniensis TaxID=990121 RepID=A0A0V0ZJH5_9BILA|nr:Jerky protein [Trichinella patagoniensis]